MNHEQKTGEKAEAARADEVAGSDSPRGTARVAIGTPASPADSIRWVGFASLRTPVATPVALALLKLEAGSLKDSADVYGLIEATRLTTGDDLASAMRNAKTTLSDWGLRAWDRVEQSLAEQAPSP